MKISAKTCMWAAFAAMSIVFFAMQATHFRYSVSDENIYFYMSKMVLEGNMPYKDFFYAHPPIHIFYLSIFYAVFGFSIFIMKATAAIPIIIAAGLMFSIVKDKIGGAAAVASTTIFYFSYDVMRFTTFATWLTLSVMFLVLGAYLAMKKKHIAAGIIMAVATLTGIFAAVGAVAAGAYLFLTDKKGFFKFAAAFLALFIAANLMLTMFFGSAFLKDVYQYHLLKPSEGGAGKTEIYWHFIKLNPLIIGGFLLFLLSRKKMFFLPASIAGAYLVALLLMNKIFGYYFLAAAPFMALAAAYGINDLMGRISESRKKQAITLLILAIAISSAASSYYYLKNDFQDFNDAEQISKWVRENSAPTDTIFGDDSITPLIGLLSGRKLAFNMADTNSLIWRSGMADINETIQKIKDEKVKFVVERRLNDGRGSYIYGVAFIDRFKEFLKKECTEAKSFKSPWKAYMKEYYLYECG